MPEKRKPDVSLDVDVGLTQLVETERLRRIHEMQKEILKDLDTFLIQTSPKHLEHDQRKTQGIRALFCKPGENITQ